MLRQVQPDEWRFGFRTFAVIHQFVAAAVLVGSSWSGLKRCALAALPVERTNQV